MVSGIFKAAGLGVGAALAGIVAVLIGILAVFLYAIFGALMGAVAGWIVAHTPVLGELVVRGFAGFGMSNADLTAIGAALGFVAGFFKPAFAGKG